MSTYAFLSNNLKQTLVYYPIPKNANTSAKYFIIKHCGPENQFNVPIDSNNRLQKEVNSFFRREIKFPSVKSNSSHLKLNLSNKQIDKLIKVYEDDLILYEEYKKIK